MLRHILGLTVMAALLAGPAAQADNNRAMEAWQQQNFEAAMAELIPAAEAGDTTAQELIGVLHALGLGVPQDRAKAFAWYMRAAEGGHAGAQSGVGWYYEVGMGGVPVDFVKAHMWYTLSTIGGDIDAAISLEDIETQMTQEQIAEAQRMATEYLAR